MPAHWFALVLILTLSLPLLGACVPRDTAVAAPGAAHAAETRIAGQVFATQTAQARTAPTQAAPRNVELAGRGESRPGPAAGLATATPRPTNTARATSTPRPPTATPLPTDTPTPSATPPPTATPLPEAIVLVDNLNMREGPGERFAVSGQLPLGLPLLVWGQQNGCEWLWIKHEDQLGWVSGNGQYVDLRLPCDPIVRGIYREQTGYLKRSSDGGALGELKVENGTDEDAIVILTLGGETVTSAYIRAGETFQLRQIRDGSYDVYFATGEHWDGDTFTLTSSRRKFDDPLLFTTSATQYTGWSVTLHAVSGGQASAAPIGEDAFPGTGQ